MKLGLTIPLIIFIKSFSSSSSNINLMVKVVEAISRVHHFGYYIVIASSEEKSDKLLRQNFFKILHSRLRFSAVVELHVNDVDEYRRIIKSMTKRKTSNIEMKCLKIYNGHNELSMQKFSDLSKNENFGGKDVWLLFLDGNIFLEKYLNSLTLPFNAQLILAIIQNLTTVHFKAPYRVVENFPLRIIDVGRWTKTDGLNLPLIDVAITRKDFEGLQLRAGTWSDPPVTIVNYKKDGNFQVDGYLADIWNELSKKLNFTYIYNLADDNVSGSVGSKNKTANGLIGMLLRDEIDVAVIQLSMTKERVDAIDFSVPIISTGNKIFYLDIGDQFEWGNFFRPFDIKVWWAILLTLIVITISLAFFHAIGSSYSTENYLLKQEYTVLGCFLTVFRAFTNQGNVLTPESAPSRIVFFSAYLTMAVVLPSYSAALISYLTVKTPYKPFDSLETMLKARSHKLATSRDSADFSYFSESNTPLVRNVFEKLMKPLEISGQLPRNPENGISLVCKNKDLAFYGNYLSGTLFAEELFLKHGCRIISMENFVSKIDECLGFQKRSPYALAINLELEKMAWSGLLRRFEKQVYLKKKDNYDSGFENITIRHVIQIQCLLFAGYILSVLILVIEVFSTREKNLTVKEKNNTSLEE